MGGVDKLDQLRSYYDAGKKIWRCICYFNIDIINSFICFKKSKSTHPRYSLLSYKNALLHGFITLTLTLTPNPYPFLFQL